MGEQEREEAGRWHWVGVGKGGRAGRGTGREWVRDGPTSRSHKLICLKGGGGGRDPQALCAHHIVPWQASPRTSWF